MKRPVFRLILPHDECRGTHTHTHTHTHTVQPGPCVQYTAVNSDNE